MKLTDFEPVRLDELAPATLASYKTKAGAAATAADAAGDVKTADKRFSGIVKATKKQFDQDAKGVAEGSGESYIIVRTDSEGKKDVFAGNFDTYERAQKELDACLAHPLHTKYKQKFEIKRKGGEQGVAEATDPKRDKAERMIWKYFGQIYDYGDDDGLNYLDEQGDLWNQLMHKYNGEIDDIVAQEPIEVLMQAAQELKVIANEMKFDLDEAGVTEAAQGHTIEAHGVRGMDRRTWHKTFRNTDQMIAWAEKHDAEIIGTRDLEQARHHNLSPAMAKGVAEGLSKRDQKDVAAIKAAIERLESQLKQPNADKDAIQQSIAHERKRLALYKQGVAEADDSKFVGFMNKTMSDKVDAPKADTLAAAPAFYRNAAVSTLDARQGFKNALKFGLKALSRLDSETRQQLVAGSEQEVEEYLTDVAERSGQMGDDTFVEEDISEVQDYLSDVFHDPSINSWKDVLQQSRGVAEDNDALAAFLARGGEVQQLKPQRGPRRSGVSFASKHIGSASGRGNTKGKVSGLGANTGKASKPVVTAEQHMAEDALAGMKRLAGIAPAQTQTTPGQRQYRHMPTAVQPR